MGKLWTASNDRGVGLFHIAGDVSLQTAQGILADNAEWTAREGVVCQVADYQTAAINLAPNALRRAALQVVRSETGGGLLVPTALLVEPDHAEMWRDYAWLMAMAGLRRAVFTEREAALAWAADQAALWEAQADHRRRVR